MKVDVLRSQPSGYELLGRCDIPALSSSYIEVMESVDQRQWSPARGHEAPRGHRFHVVRPGPAGADMALVLIDGADPEILPGWTPAGNQAA